MQVLKLMHVCIAVPDLDQALDFYCNTLGMKTDLDFEDYGVKKMFATFAKLQKV